jgi:catechol-2,3-dioxygenase
LRVGIPLGGASDRGVSAALYLRGPDGNGVELYWVGRARKMASLQWSLEPLIVGEPRVDQVSQEVADSQMLLDLPERKQVDQPTHSS